MSDTTFRGDVAELMTAAELVRRGYIVSRPLTNGAAYDLLVDLGENIVKIQVKRASRTKTGAVRIVLSSSKYHRGRSSVSYAGRVDYLVGVDCDTREFYVVQGDNLKMAEIALRDAPSRNNQQIGTRAAADYKIHHWFPLKPMVDRSGIEPLTPSV